MTTIKATIITIILLLFMTGFVRNEIDESQIETIESLKVQIADVAAHQIAFTLTQEEIDVEILSKIEETTGGYKLIRTQDNFIFNISTSQFETAQISDVDLEMIEYVLQNQMISTKEVDGIIDIFAPVTSSDGEIIAILKTEYIVTYNETFGYAPEITSYVILIMCIMCFIPVLIAFRDLNKITKIDKIMRKKGFYLTPQKGYSRVTKMSQIFVDMSKSIIKHNQNMLNLKHSYEPFVPSEIIRIFDKKDIMELEVGQKKDMDAVILIIKAENFLRVVGENEESEVFEYANEIFNIIIDELGEGLLINFNQLDSQILFESNINNALKIASKILAKIEKHPKTFNGKKVEFSYVATMTEANLGIIGSNKRSELLININENNLINELSKLANNFKTGVLFCNSRIKNRKNTRLIAQSADGRYIFEDYSGKSSEIVKLNNLTKEVFEQSVIDFIKGDKQKANAGFISVIRKNNNDLMAYHYFEKCNEEILIGS